MADSASSGVWSIPLQTIVDETKADIDTVVRKVTLQLFSAIGVRSPVDTGRFRANWNVAYAQPDRSVTQSTDQSRLAIETAKANTLDVGGVVYMTNSLPYAGVLEFGGYPNPVKFGSKKRGETERTIHAVGGYSKQAPAGMVRVTVVEFDAAIKAAIAAGKGNK